MNDFWKNLLLKHKWIVMVGLLIVLVLLAWTVVFQGRELSIGGIRIGPLNYSDPPKPVPPKPVPPKPVPPKPVPPKHVPPKSVPIESKSETINILGTWNGSPDCSMVFFRDDGKNVEGSCDNNSFKHRINGIYKNDRYIEMTVTRIGPDNCSTSAKGYINIKNNDSLIFGQEGWNGCGAHTASGQMSLIRNK